MDVEKRTRFGVDLSAGEEPDAWIVGGGGSEGADMVAYVAGGVLVGYGERDAMNGGAAMFGNARQ